MSKGYSRWVTVLCECAKRQSENGICSLAQEPESPGGYSHRFQTGSV